MPTDPTTDERTEECATCGHSYADDGSYGSLVATEDGQDWHCYGCQDSDD